MKSFYSFLGNRVSSSWSRWGYFFVCFFSSIHLVFADLQIVEIFPNTVDDKNLEYVEIRNTGCESVNIGDYTLEDALPKVYTVPLGTSIDSHANYRFVRPMTKLELNNTNESVRLRNSLGSIVNEYSYANSTKGTPISIAYIDQDCTALQVTPSDEPAPLGSGNLITTSGEGVIVEEHITLIPLEQDPIPDMNIRDEVGDPIDTVSLSGGELSSEGFENTSFTSAVPQEMPSEILTESGVISSGTVLSQEIIFLTGSVDPLTLLYDDIDGDLLYDRLLIDYGVFLTGSVDISSIFLYSATGGLYQDRMILTETGHILNGYLSGTYLILDLLEGDRVHTGELSINNTTKSHLRLKSSGDLGFYTLDGRSPSDFFLTTSFHSYKNVGRFVPALTYTDPNKSRDTSTTLETQSGEVLFPLVVPTLQRYSDVLYESGSVVCRDRECRINLTFEPIFSSGFSLSEYSCRVVFGDQVRDDCNPPQWVISATGSISVTLIHKITNRIQVTYLPVIYNPLSLPPGSPMTSPDMTPPVLIVEMDGKWKKYYEQVGDHEIHCYVYTCSINLTADQSYDPEGGKLRFIWLYDMQNYTDSKDPGTRTFTLGDHDIWVRAVDLSGNMSQIHYIVRVFPPKEEEAIVKPKKAPKQKAEKISSNSKPSQKKKTKKKLKMAFFEPPQILLQNKTPTLKNEDIIHCQTKTKYCSINLKIENPIPGIEYTWVYPDGTEVVSKNPRSFRFVPGIQSMTLRARYAGSEAPLYTKIYNIYVQKTTKTRTKKSLIKNTSQSKKVSSQSLSMVVDQTPPFVSTYSLYIILFVGCMAMVLCISVFWSRRRVFLPSE